MIERTCDNCGKTILAYKSTIRKNAKYHYCSTLCKYEHQTITMLGKNNPNYNNRWSDNQKQKQSLKIKDNYDKDPTLRYRCSPKGTKKPNLSKKLKEYYKTHDANMKGKHHSKKTKLIIGKKSKAKFTKEYKELQRKQYEQKGIWIPLNQKSDYMIYYKESNWIQRMFDIITDSNQQKLLKEFGIFNSYSNTKGVVRDHMYSRLSGFKNGVFPQILRHPCNCQIILHASNVAKKQNRYIDDDSQTLEELFTKILQYDKIWIEQDICKKLIQDYLAGKRWIRNN